MAEQFARPKEVRLLMGRAPTVENNPRLSWWMRPDDIERLLARVVFRDRGPGACWIWSGTHMGAWQNMPVVKKRIDRDHKLRVVCIMWALYRCKDGEWVPYELYQECRGTTALPQDIEGMINLGGKARTLVTGQHGDGRIVWQDWQCVNPFHYSGLVKMSEGRIVSSVPVWREHVHQHEMLDDPTLHPNYDWRAAELEKADWARAEAWAGVNEMPVDTEGRIIWPEGQGPVEQAIQTTMDELDQIGKGGMEEAIRKMKEELGL